MNYLKKYFKGLHKRKFGSSCCGYPVRVEGRVTQYYVCDKCDRPCDLVKMKKRVVIKCDISTMIGRILR